MEAKQEQPAVMVRVRQLQAAMERYRQGLSEVTGDIGTLHAQLEKLHETLQAEDAARVLARYDEQLEALQEEAGKAACHLQELDDSRAEEAGQFQHVSEFAAAVQNFTASMEDFNQRADALSQKLYHKDFNNAVKAQQTLAADAKREKDRELRHVTDHDFDILKEQYQASLANCAQQELVRAYLQAAGRLLLGARLRHAEREALHGLMLKLQHSDSKALQSFLDDVLQRCGKTI
ncbi:hypothetical protein [Mitsuokella sp. AF21-1AC]|uniref:hypothetical protein n=1 Tax=Mitsuokella sp. AF21-1AC TaxID=2292235 RepID=UPI000E490B41|nr:hypothetical protein [Mitsuokella sp. AF21-1AC]RGS72139.1 hypothetical protein DWX75_07215 [Mitsuokella sp. AF21-1AC]